MDYSGNGLGGLVRTAARFAPLLPSPTTTTAPSSSFSSLHHQPQDHDLSTRPTTKATSRGMSMDVYEGEAVSYATKVHHTSMISSGSPVPAPLSVTYLSRSGAAVNEETRSMRMTTPPPLIEDDDDHHQPPRRQSHDHNHHNAPTLFAGNKSTTSATSTHDLTPTSTTTTTPTATPTATNSHLYPWSPSLYPPQITTTMWQWRSRAWSDPPP